MEIDYKFRYDCRNPFLIYQRKKIDKNTEDILGVMNVKGHKIEVNDIIDSIPQLTNGKYCGDFVINEVTRRFTPQGAFLIDVENAGFEVIAAKLNK